MYISEAKNKVKIINDKSDDQYLIKLHRMSSKFYMENKNIHPNKEVLEEAISNIKDNLGIILTAEKLKDLLVLYPFVRIDLAYYEEIDSEIRDKLNNMVCNYLIGSNLPTYGDGLTPEEHEIFYNHLQEEAFRVGYKINREE